MVGPEGVGGGESGDYCDDLEEGAAVVAGDFGGGVHGLKEFQEDAWGESGHFGEGRNGMKVEFLRYVWRRSELGETEHCLWD